MKNEYLINYWTYMYVCVKVAKVLQIPHPPPPKEIFFGGLLGLLRPLFT